MADSTEELDSLRRDSAALRAAGERLARYEAVVDSSRDLLALLDRELRYVVANSAYCDFVGVPPSEIVGKRVDEVLGRELFEGTLRRHLERALDGEPVRFEAWVETPRGGRGWRDTCYVPFVREPGVVEGVVVSARDATAVSRLEDERDLLLHAMEERVAELRCLYRVSELASSSTELHATLDEVARVAPSGFRLPEKTGVRIVWDGREHGSAGFVEAPRFIAEELAASGAPRGRIEAHRLEKKPDLARGPFRADEVELLRAIAAALSGAAERLESEARLRASEHDLASLVESSPDAILVVDDRHEIRLGNAAAAALLGRRPEVLAGETFGVAMTAGGFSEVELLGPDGRIRSAELRSTRVAWKGEPATLVVLRDVTDRRRAEAELRESREKLASIFDNVGIGVALVDRSMRVLEANRQMREWCPGVDLESRPLCYRAFHEPPRDEPCLGCPTAETFADGEVHERLTEPAAGPKARRYRIVSSPLRDAEGRVAASIELAYDVTERHEMEAQLRQMQRLESVGRLAGGVAHDLNNLLTVILPRSTFALEDPSLTGVAREDVEAVRDAAQKAASLTRQLLAFSRKQVLQPRALDLSEVARGLAKLVRRVIGEDLRLEVDAKAGLPAVHADPGKVEQALMNLCVNARDAMPGGGTLRIETAEVALDETFAATRPWALQGRFVRLRVADTGTGMDAETLASCFEPFFTTKPADKGTGLGLASVYGIVKQHGGMVDVASAPGRGTTFDLYFPLPEAEAAAHGEAVEVTALGGTETLLLAEDDAEVRGVAARILADAGYRVLTAADGAAAVELFDAHRDEIDLVLLDAVMPGLGGGEVRDHIRRAGSDVPVLFCSGYSPEALLSHLGDADAVAVVNKPFTIQSLLRPVREMLESRR